MMYVEKQESNSDNQKEEEKMMMSESMCDTSDFQQCEFIEKHI